MVRVPDWTPLTTTVSDMLVKARDEGSIITQSGLMDGGKAAVVAAYGDEAEALMRWVRKRCFDPTQRSIHTFQEAS